MERRFSYLQSAHQPLDPDQRYHSLDIVGEDVQRDLCFHIPQSLGQKVGRAHPRLDGAMKPYRCKLGYEALAELQSR